MRAVAILVMVLGLSSPGLAAYLWSIAYAEVLREHAKVAAFRKTHPCPATGKTTGPCPGYVVDHMYPLCAGGADEPENMMWQEHAASLVKDRLERDLCRCRAGRGR